MHDEISAAQRSFWRGKDAQTINLDDVIAFSNKLETEYGSRWLGAGSKAKDFTRVKNLVQNDGLKFGLGKAARWQRLGLGVAAALPVIAVLESNARAQEKMVKFDPNTHPEFRQFMESYEYALDEAIRTNRVSKRSGEQLADTFCAFARSMSLDETTVEKIRQVFYAWIQKDLTP